MRTALAITLALLVFAGGIAPAVSAGSHAGPSDHPTSTSGDAGTPVGPADPVAVDEQATDDEEDDEREAPPDPDEDVLGWEEVDGHGIWYNESLDIDNSDGLTQTELDKLVARTMARIEVIRELEFQTTTPVDIRSREQYRRNVSDAYANVTNEGRVHQNVKYEATFLIPEGQDAIDVLESNRASSVAGYYSPTENQIVVISDDPDTLQMDELTLAHELAHAVQDQHFNISKYDRSTEDENNAISGIIEGDAHYVEQLYQERCNDTDSEWNGTCVRPTGDGTPGGGADLHIGVYLISFQPYSDGPAFVHSIYQDGGWEAVNQVYEDPPDSAEQVMHPEKYPDEEPADLDYRDRSSDEWEVLELEGENSVNYATFGEGGLFSMFWYPSYRERGDAIVPYNQLFDVPEGGYNAYNYGFWITDGWNGDELYPYVPADQDEYSYEETGYVWKLEWDTERDAEQFVRGYDDLLKYYDAEEVEDRRNTYVIPDDGQFGDAYYVQREGTTVWIVNAPSVEELSAVREGAAPEAEDTATTTTTEGGDDTTTTTGDDDDTTTTTTTTEDGDDGGDGQGTPGFGIAAAVVALLAGALLAARRYRD